MTLLRIHNECAIFHSYTSNVLLDDDMNAHVGDFGLAKFFGGVITNVESEYHTNSTSIGIRGSIGYAAPEYEMGSEVSTKGDVYSYGIMLLEMFTGRRPTDDMFEDGYNLHSFATNALVTDGVLQIVDPALIVPTHLQEVKINDEAEAKMSKALTWVLKLGVGCSNDSPTQRLEMVQVVRVLQSIKNTYLLDLDMEL
ncbi:putative receptor-like protein kinase At3g47110 [Papaver somniferum]|uniref:putative receptor-like protein kinase At3g47110 n=1 Tax=Papaver somniferum TaxID=3469 RepID=UPI000E6F7E3B|nr:putative receptor-like protein kinase At3g47110 [Papaver somniferum]